MIILSMTNVRAHHYSYLNVDNQYLYSLIYFSKLLHDSMIVLMDLLVIGENCQCFSCKNFGKNLRIARES